MIRPPSGPSQTSDAGARAIGLVSAIGRGTVKTGAGDDCVANKS